MSLEIDNEENLSFSPQNNSTSRSSRQIVSEASISAVLVYIGGAENSPMFNGCIKYPYLSRPGAEKRLLTAGMQCGENGAVCGGNPSFNSCERKKEAFGIRSKPTKSIQKHKRKKPRASRVNLPSNLVVSLASLREGYDTDCSLPFFPHADGLKYIGNGYTKNYLKRFNTRNWRYSFSMRTTERSGLMFFMSDQRCHEHIAVYLIKGKVAFSTMFDNQRSLLKSTARYSDGGWHQITFERKGNLTQLRVDGRIEDQGVLSRDSWFFPRNIPFYIGGLEAPRKQFAASRIHRRNLVDFRGCIKELEVNNKIWNGKTSGTKVEINVLPCFAGGEESGMYFQYRENGENPSYLIVDNTYNVGADMEVTVDIKPRLQSGLIFAVGGTSGNFFNLALIEGRVVARLRQGDETLFTRYDPYSFSSNLCDGNWHSIKVTKAKNIVALTVDGNLVTPVEEGELENSLCLTNGPLFVGGIPDGVVIPGILTTAQYTGCMRRMEINFFTVNTDRVLTAHGNILPNACPRS